MSRAEKYAEWIIANESKKGTPEFDTVVAAYKAARSESDPAAHLRPEAMRQNLLDNVMGAVRGAGSIGATLATPYDMLRGNTSSIGNPERRAKMDEGAREAGANPESVSFQGPKLLTEIAGTAGVPGVLGKAVGTVAPRVGQAIASGGFSTGAVPAAGVIPKAADMAIRSAGGAVAGGAQAGIIDPEFAKTGAVIGAALPPAAKIVGEAGKVAGKVWRGAPQTAAQQAAITEARNAGYVVPPTQAKPSLINRIIEGMSGKITTAQNASARNQAVTNKLANRALGLPDDTLLTPQVIKGIKDGAGNAYDMLGQAGAINAGTAYTQALDGIAAPYLQAARGFPNAKPSPVINLVESLKTQTFDAADAVSMIKQLRTQADDGFRTGNTDIARAAKKAAAAIEDAIERNLQATGNTQLLDDFREARTLYAKAIEVERAYNPTTGTVDARKLGTRIRQNKPLSGELKQAGDFANAFPKAAQTTEGMGSLPQTSPLDWVPSTMAAVATGNPLMMAGVGARPAARSLSLSPLVQNRLIQMQQPNALTQMLGPDAARLLYRGAPYLAVDR